MGFEPTTTSQQTFVCLQDMSWRRLQHVFSVTILHLPRRLKDVLQRRFEDVLKMSWRPLARRLQDVLEDEKLLCWRLLEDVLKTYLENVLITCLEDMSWRCLEDMSWRPLKDFMDTKKILTGDICILVSGFKKPKCVSNKSVFQKSISENSKANPKCIN